MSKPPRMPRTLRHTVSDIVVTVSFAAIALAMLITMTDIVLRLAAQGAEVILGSRPRWSIAGVVDLMQLLIMVAVSFAIAATFLTDRHIRIDLLLNRMGPGMRRASVAVSALTGVAVIGTCLWSAWREFQGQLDFTSASATLGLPFTWYWAPLILGLAISLLCCVWQVFRPGNGAARISSDDDV